MQWINEVIEQSLGLVRFGVLTIVVQDGHVVQVERTETFQARTLAAEKPVTPDESMIRRVRQHVAAVISEMRYGEIRIKIGNGRVSQIEKVEKRRLENLFGLDGAGI